MNRLKTWFGNTFWNGYSVWERLFLFGMVALQVIVFCITPDTPLNIIAGIAGVLSVVLCAKGKLANYFIGFIQNFTYTALAFQNQFYGEVIEQGFYIATMIWGIFVWKANMDKAEDGTESVMTKKFTPLQWVLSIAGTVAATIAFGYFLDGIGSAQAYTDAATNIMALFAQLMMVRRYREQWFWWFVIDVFCIKMWWVAGNWSKVYPLTAQMITLLTSLMQILDDEFDGDIAGQLRILLSKVLAVRQITDTELQQLMKLLSVSGEAQHDSAREPIPAEPEIDSPVSDKEGEWRRKAELLRRMNWERERLFLHGAVYGKRLVKRCVYHLRQLSRGQTRGQRH